ncbi:hypothetical protein QEZ52_04895 [Aliisedimentitalea scapharcae]|uniref:Uncharacterized protein n=1 Tax=Aliisedimentitalea scapharcae TaxID=1524259 RepID=A0ABZ2XUV4_9RHOB
MTGTITIPTGERAIIRVFTLDMRPEQVKFLSETGALEQVLGIEEMNRDQIEIFSTDDLEELGLTGYLIEGCGLSPEEIDPQSDVLSAIKGDVLLIRSRAFGGRETRLNPADQIQLVATLSEPSTNWSGTPIETASAQLYSATKQSPRAARARARRIGFTLFAVMMALITIVLLLLVF